jgi:hypothetical protein
MPKIKVTLRIVGIYLRKDYTVSVGANPTVKEVMLAIQDQDPDFRFKSGTVKNRETLLSASHYWGGRTQTAQKDARARGWYTLTDENSAPTFPGKSQQVLTWQYYLGNPARTIDGKFIPFGEKAAKTEVKDGDLILWRLVTILVAPNGEPPLP